MAPPLGKDTDRQGEQTVSNMPGSSSAAWVGESFVVQVMVKLSLSGDLI